MGVGPYPFNFEVLAQTDIAVYFNDTELTLTTDYTVSDVTVDGTGSVTIVVGTNVPTTPDVNDRITIVGDRTIERTTDFTTGGPLFATSLNDEFDSLTIFAQQVLESNERAIKAPVTDPSSIDMTLPKDDDRKGKYLSFNASTGNPEVVNTVTDVTTIAGIASDVTTVSGIASNVTTVAGNNANVTTVATNISSVNTVATNIADVITVANDLNEAISEIETAADDLNEAVSEIDTVSNSITNVDAVGTNIANVNTVAGISANVTTVAGVSANVTTVAGISANVTTVAGISSDVTTVAADGTDIGTVAGLSTEVGALGPIASDITTVAGISADVTTVAADGTDIGTVAGISGNVTTVAGISGNVTTVAGISGNVTTVAGISSDVTTAAANVADITNFADVYYGPSASAPSTRKDSSALQEGDLYFNTSVNQLYVWDGSTWDEAAFNTTGAVLSFNTRTGAVTLSAADVNTALGSDAVLDSDIGVTVEAYDATILKSADIGTTVQGYDADTAKYDDATANFTGTLQNGGSNVVVDSDIGSSVQAYNANLTAINQALTTTSSPTFATLNATTVDLGDWTVTESTGVLYFATGGVNKMKLDASGNLTVVGDVTAYGTV
jgi:tetrahydromethanopterin S-methyltransferase subunit B